VRPVEQSQQWSYHQPLSQMWVEAVAALRERLRSAWLHNLQSNTSESSS
jgi:hypothetical protein